MLIALTNPTWGVSALCVFKLRCLQPLLLFTGAGVLWLWAVSCPSQVLCSGVLPPGEVPGLGVVPATGF